MTKRLGNTVIIEHEAAQQCDLCAKIAELRPYGPNGEMICYQCGMANRPATEAAFAKLLSETSDRPYVDEGRLRAMKAIGLVDFMLVASPTNPKEPE